MKLSSSFEQIAVMLDISADAAVPVAITLGFFDFDAGDRSESEAKGWGAGVRTAGDECGGCRGETARKFSSFTEMRHSSSPQAASAAEGSTRTTHRPEGKLYAPQMEPQRPLSSGFERRPSIRTREPSYKLFERAAAAAGHGFDVIGGGGAR